MNTQHPTRWSWLRPMSRAIARATATRKRKALLLVVALFFVLEGLARLTFVGPFTLVGPSADPRLLYELRPGTFVSDGYIFPFHRATYTIRADGCRVSTKAAADAPATDVVVLGSSTVFAFGAEFEDTIGARLRAALQRTRGAPVEVASCAIPGHRLPNSLRTAELQLHAKHPRVIAVFVLPHHLSRSINWALMTPSNPTVAWLTGHLRLGRVAYLQYINQVRGVKFDKLGYEEPDKLTQSLDQLVSAVRGTTTKVVFFLMGEVVHPSVNLERELTSRGLEVHHIESPPQRPEFWAVEDGGPAKPYPSAIGAEFIVSQVSGTVDAALGPSHQN